MTKQQQQILDYISRVETNTDRSVRRDTIAAYLHPDVNADINLLIDLGRLTYLGNRVKIKKNEVKK